MKHEPLAFTHRCKICCNLLVLLKVENLKIGKLHYNAPTNRFTFGVYSQLFLGFRFDDKEVTKHQWVGRGGDGFPTLEGNETKVVGDELIIRWVGGLSGLLI